MKGMMSFEVDKKEQCWGMLKAYPKMQNVVWIETPQNKRRMYQTQSIRGVLKRM